MCSRDKVWDVDRHPTINLMTKPFCRISCGIVVIQLISWLYATWFKVRKYGKNFQSLLHLHVPLDRDDFLVHGVCT